MVKDVYVEATHIYKPTSKDEVRLVYRVKGWCTSERHQRTFSTLKYGEEGAYQLAHDARLFINKTHCLPPGFTLRSLCNSKASTELHGTRQTTEARDSNEERNSSGCHSGVDGSTTVCSKMNDVSKSSPRSDGLTSVTPPPSLRHTKSPGKWRKSMKFKKLQCHRTNDFCRGRVEGVISKEMECCGDLNMRHEVTVIRNEENTLTDGHISFNLKENFEAVNIEKEKVDASIQDVDSRSHCGNSLENMKEMQAAIEPCNHLKHQSTCTVGRMHEKRQKHWSLPVSFTPKYYRRKRMEDSSKVDCMVSRLKNSSQIFNGNRGDCIKLLDESATSCETKANRSLSLPFGAAVKSVCSSVSQKVDVDTLGCASSCLVVPPKGCAATSTSPPPNQVCTISTGDCSTTVGVDDFDECCKRRIDCVVDNQIERDTYTPSSTVSECCDSKRSGGCTTDNRGCCFELCYPSTKSEEPTSDVLSEDNSNNNNVNTTLNRSSSASKHISCPKISKDVCSITTNICTACQSIEEAPVYLETSDLYSYEMDAYTSHQVMSPVFSDVVTALHSIEDTTNMIEVSKHSCDAYSHGSTGRCVCVFSNLLPSEHGKQDTSSTVEGDVGYTSMNEVNVMGTHRAVDDETLILYNTAGEESNSKSEAVHINHQDHEYTVKKIGAPVDDDLEETFISSNGGGGESSSRTHIRGVTKERMLYGSNAVVGRPIGRRNYLPQDAFELALHSAKCLYGTLGSDVLLRH